MLKSLILLSVGLTSSAFAQPGFSGVVQDASQGPIDGARITVFDLTGKGVVQTTSSTGNFSLSGIPEGDYLFKVEDGSRMPFFGAIHLAGDQPHKINVVMLDASPQARTLSVPGPPSETRCGLRDLRPNLQR